MFNNQLYTIFVESVQDMMMMSSTNAIRVMKSEDGQWASADGGTPLNVSPDPLEHVSSPFLAVYNNELYAIWEEGISPRSIYVKKLQGNTWVPVTSNSTPLNGTAGSRNGYMPAMIAHNGFLYAAWVENGSIQVKKYNGTWTNESIISLKPNSTVTFPAFAVHNNEIYLTWSEQLSSSPYSYYIPVMKRAANGIWHSVSGVDGISESTAPAVLPKMQTYKGLLYAVWKTDTAYKIKAYNETSWSWVGDGTFPAPPNITPQYMFLTVFHDKLFANWVNPGSGFIPLLLATATYYDGANWTPASSGLESSYTDGRMGAVVPTDDLLYMVWAHSGKIRVSAYKEGPPAPVGVQVTRNGSDSAALSWTVGTGITGYKVYMGTQSGTYGSAPLATLPGTQGSYTATGLEAGNTYYLAVKAVNADGESSYSAEVSVAIPQPAPTLSGLEWGTGSTPGTIRVTELPGIGTYKYAIADPDALSQPMVGDDAAVAYTQTLQKNVDFAMQSGKRVFVVEVDGNNRILKWAGIPIADSLIAAAAPPIVGLVWAPGSVPDTTKATQLPGTGTYKYALGAAGSFTQPVSGADAAQLGYTNSLVTNGNISVTSGQHIFVVEVDTHNKIVKWSDVLVTEEQIAQLAPSLDGLTWGTGKYIGTTRATQLPGAGVYKYAIGEAGVYSHPLTGADAGALNYAATLALSSNIAVRSGQHLYVVEVDSSNGILQWTQIPIADDQIMEAVSPILHTPVAGAGQVTLSWSSVNGATGYALYASTTSGQYGTEMTTVASSVYEHAVTGLVNGTTYYFVVKAKYDGVDGPPSNERSATPQVPLPGVPVLNAPVAGNGQAALSWNPVGGAMGYKIYVSTTSGQYGSEIATVGGSVYGHSVVDLVNGTTYYFVVKAMNAGGDSAASNEGSTVPGSVPTAPYQVSATAGDGQATVTFQAPADNGGFALTGYEVTASPGNITATGTTSPITVTGLTNGTAYTFTVKAINRLGGSAASELSNAVTPSLPSGDDSDGDNSPPTPSEPSAPSQPSTPSVNPDTTAIVYVNGKAENAGVVTTTTVNDRKVTMVALDPKKLDEKLAAEGSGAVITIPVTANADTIIGELNGRMVKNLEQKQGVVRLQTPYGIYIIPASQIRIDAVSEQLGKAEALENIAIRIEVAVSASDTVRVVQNTAADDELTVVVPPHDFTIRAVTGDDAVEVNQFDSYVERMIAIPEGVDPTRITTGVVLKAGDTLAHVPTKVTQFEGNYYAVINSLTNSSYAVIYNVKTFDDIAGHWAKASIDDMASRLVVNGTTAGQYKPDHEITRAEFTAIVVRALGLRKADQAPAFDDMKSSDWSYEAVSIGASYGLVQGYENGTFGPDRKITRQEAMTILSKAMTLIGMDLSVASGQQEKLLAAFSDKDLLSDWAALSAVLNIRYGIVEGSGEQLRPQANITRAETAAIVQRLLQKAGLI
ncbi:fibronectin type III domain-containing protein [Paenibacillus sp. IB182363]|uniref:Fibronectin type III domain-containing protein n=2 Tax=Paenibacillus oceani TaxID=2772510 RepID=A0A927H0Y2_9BACL|nr:fibronectin type III domain-containing protein [Paenibacillus oceani]